MNLQKNYSLKELNSFNVEAKTKYFVEIFSVEELRKILVNDNFSNYKKLVLGGGSNILFTKDYDGLIIKNSIPGISIVNENEKEVIIESGGGVDWDELVKYCVNKNYGGIENLSLIPGSVGAAPVQNIGAYGQELKDCFEELSGLFIDSGKHRIFRKFECDFSYRNSNFKSELRNKFIITSVRLKLSKRPFVNLSYQQVKEELLSRKIEKPSISDIRDIVIAIRKSKLPDPKKLGNAGSFFKNPVVNLEKFNFLKEVYPVIKSFPASENKVKISAAWLIEMCGWKEKRIGDAGVHQKQPLVIVNYGSASGEDIYNLSGQIKNSVTDKFGIDLENEVNII
jgi:UDP-N-acetylmuramate dehydrogenase